MLPVFSWWAWDFIYFGVENDGSTYCAWISADKSFFSFTKFFGEKAGEIFGFWLRGSILRCAGEKNRPILGGLFLLGGFAIVGTNKPQIVCE